MQRVLVLDSNKQPLMPCHPARARALLKAGKAAVFRRFPFTLILKERENGEVQDIRLKLDPGSQKTGIAVVAEFAQRGPTVIWAAELEHRGQAIHCAMEKRSHLRHSRRSRTTRHRAPRYRHRTRTEGWLPPSIAHRVLTTWTWVQRLTRWIPVAALSQELVRFDTQALQDPEISGVEYQQGTLAGYEVREYLLEKWGRKCAYCDTEKVPMEIDHIHPKSRGGSDRISNLTLACHACNQEKGQQPLEKFLETGEGRRRRMLVNAEKFAAGNTKKAAQRKTYEQTRLQRIQSQARAPLRDAAAVNSTRWAIWERLKATGLDVEVGTGGRTKWNRTRQDYPKMHWVDAACVGESGGKVRLKPALRPLQITATGHGRRQMQNMTENGFPRGKAKSRQKVYFGFQTGDMVRAVVPRGRFKGTHVGRVACKKSGSFKLKVNGKELDGVSWRYCTPIHQGDGYAYTL